jgi:hypothetical protein
MPWTERHKCSFEVMTDGEGQASRIYITIDGHHQSLLGSKHIGRLFFGLSKGTKWDEATELAEQMQRMLGPLCINHLAAGEDG